MLKRISKKKIWKIISRVIAFLLTGFLIGYQIYLLNARSIGKNLLPMPFGYGQAVVMSGSMSPAFEVDDLLIYHAEDDYQVGDMVAFIDHDGSLVTHRMIQKDGEMIVTQGDANSMEDDPISEEQICGKVIYIIPNVGTIVRILQEPSVVLLLIMLLLAGLEWNYRQSKKEAKKRLDEQRKELDELRRELDQ